MMQLGCCGCFASFMEEVAVVFCSVRIWFGPAVIA
jgi:hypothetical protein